MSQTRLVGLARSNIEPSIARQVDILLVLLEMLRIRISENRLYSS